jgi:hypothetical protein
MVTSLLRAVRTTPVSAGAVVVVLTTVTAGWDVAANSGREFRAVQATRTRPEKSKEVKKGVAELPRIDMARLQCFLMGLCGTSSSLSIHNGRMARCSLTAADRS